MTFTYQPSATPDDVTRVRYHIGDTDESAAAFSDEEITMAIAEEGEWKPAVVSLIRSLIGKLSTPDFQADWLRVSTKSAREGYASLLKEKQRELGVSSVRASGKPVYRGDSNATEAPDW